VVGQLVVDAQGHLAAREDALAGNLVEEGADQGADVLDEVLAIVENQDGLRARESLAQLRTPGNVQGLGDHLFQDGRAVDGFESDQPDTAGNLQLSCQLQQEPGLAHPSRSDDVYEPVFCDELAQG